MENKTLPALPEVQVQYVPAQISVNFDALQEALTAQVAEQSATVVTLETLKSGKELAAEMNKTAKAIKDARIKYAKEAGAPIAEFESKMKELERIALDGRAKVDAQNKRFEAEKIAEAATVLAEYLAQQYQEKGVQPEFQRYNTDDLPSLTALTGTGKPTSKVKAEIDSRVSLSLQLQQQTEIRLLQLENESFKAGLAAPLMRHHVEVFLFESEEIYQMRLARLFEAELQRESQARQMAEQRAADEARRNAEALERAAQAEARNKQLAEQQEQMRLQQQEQLRQQQERHQQELEAAKQQSQQQFTQQHQQNPAQQQPAAYQDAKQGRFVVCPVLDRVNVKRLTVTQSEAELHAMNQAHQSGTAELWAYDQNNKPSLVAIVLTGQAAINYRNAAKGE